MRDRRQVLFMLVVAYGGFYTCRANVDAALPLLAMSFGFTKTELGLLSSIPIACYAVGKLVTGALGDVIGGRRLIVIAAFGSVLATLAFGASSALGAFIVFASMNRIFQSGGWSGAVDVVAHHFDRPHHGRVMGVLSTSYELGNVVAILLCSAITATLPGFRPLFVINPILLAGIGLLAGRILSDPPRRPTPRGLAVAPVGARADPFSTDATSVVTHDTSIAIDDSSMGAVLRALATQPAFWIVVLLSALLTFLRIGFLTWTPTYLYEVSRAAGHAAVSGSIAKSAIFPAAGVVSAMSVGAISDRFGPGRRAPVMAVSLAVVVVVVLTLAHGGVRSPIAAAVLIGAAGLFLLGPYSLLAGAIALDVSGKRGAATASGVIDSAGYLGATASGVVLGAVAEARGWSGAFDVVAGAALAAALAAGAWALAVVRSPKRAATHPS
jgi:sugar phosphate permease